ncbi:Rossmann-fold NAD(P)-binding domain-containing protein [Capillimicrobium parvum]|uniref:NAD(P)H azoreductase n=1 Tax=Capillimicrobium parvum TaxID=2884022 RepID=A0A9E6Y272_9ACTN|nr:NAD(P)H-binding protein [Capillimicrobium parvum]UGS38635.1 NAD(P)H azoreductase [Capillimicrobium parvum]
MSTPDQLTFITNGTGKTGRRIAERLQSAGHPVRIGSRAGAPPFDWNDHATWPATIDGVSAVYLAYHPDLAVPGAAETVAELADLAVRAGARRIVLLSGRGEEEAQRAEQLVRAADADVTVLRCAWFHQNFSESFFAEPVAAGELALPVGDDVREPFVDADDIADTAAAALTEDGHAGELYELTGPRLMTFAHATHEIAAATGRPVRFTSVPLGSFTAGLSAAQVPPGEQELLAHLFGEVLDGRNATLSDGVQRALGREPRDFCTFARETAAAGAWPTPR